MDNLNPAPSTLAYDSAATPIDEEIAALSELFNLSAGVETKPPKSMKSLVFYHPLPTETLETIFLLCARNYYSESRGDPILTPPYWVNVSYVCRQWRDVALNFPSLWTYLFITSSRWTEELLARSKQAPLKLNVNLSGLVLKRQGSRFLEQVINHSERIQDLCLYLCMLDYEAILSKLSLPAPRLEHLEILSEGFPTELSTPLLLFDGDTPALHTLKLTDCPVSWHSLKLTGLTTLSLRHLPDQFRQSVPDFLATLRYMQDLKHLYLHNALASGPGFLSSAAFYNFQRLNLPHLSQLVIAAPLSTVIALLSCINVPLGTLVRLQPDPPGEVISTFEDYTPLFLLLTERYGMSKDQAVPSPTIRSLGIHYHNAGLVILSFSTSERDPFVPSEWRHDLPLQILLHLGSSTMNNAERFISRTCCSIPMPNVQSLDVTFPPTSSAFWTNILSHCPDLRCIKLSDGYMPNLASPFSPTPQSRTETGDEYVDCGPSYMLAPALEKLELYNISFSPGGMDAVEVADLESLCDALGARKGPRGRLIMTLGREHISDRLQKNFDMEGYWGDGRFCRVYYKENYYDTLS